MAKVRMVPGSLKGQTAVILAPGLNALTFTAQKIPDSWPVFAVDEAVALAHPSLWFVSSVNQYKAWKSSAKKGTAPVFCSWHCPPEETVGAPHDVVEVSSEHLPRQVMRQVMKMVKDPSDPKQKRLIEVEVDEPIETWEPTTPWVAPSGGGYAAALCAAKLMGVSRVFLFGWDLCRTIDRMLWAHQRPSALRDQVVVQASRLRQRGPNGERVFQSPSQRQVVKSLSVLLRAGILNQIEAWIVDPFVKGVQDVLGTLSVEEFRAMVGENLPSVAQEGTSP